MLGVAAGGSAGSGVGSDARRLGDDHIAVGLEDLVGGLTPANPRLCALDRTVTRGFHPCGQGAHLAAGLEVLESGVAHRHRPGVANARLDRPAETGNERQNLPGDGAKRESPAENHRELLDALGTQGLPVGGRNLKHHLGLVGGHDRQVSARESP